MHRSPVLRNSTMLNMERMVGTITPKKVFSFRGSLLGVPELDSGVMSDLATHATVVRPHRPEVIKGVRSFDMVGEKRLSACPVKKKSMRTGLKQKYNYII